MAMNFSDKGKHTESNIPANGEDIPSSFLVPKNVECGCI